VGINLLVFLGVVHLRFYDVEVRAARTQDLLAGGAEVERMALLGALSASLAHEIRNPLTGMRSLAQRLAEEEIDDERRRRYAGVILQETARLDRLVASLLGLARRSTPAPGPAPVPLAPLFEDLVLLLDSRARGASVALERAETTVIVHARPEPLAQILLNLLINGIQHTPPGGSVRLEARESPIAVEIGVHDGGPGIPAGAPERIWEPFHSTSGGTGLGLAIVRRLAGEEGWTVDVENTPGGGATFRLCIPRTGTEGPGAPAARQDGRRVAAGAGTRA
jgi:signal transduction histidine kinase